MKVASEEAEAIALKALQFIAQDDAVLEAFLGSTGMDLASLLARASEPALLGGVLDFLLQTDSMVCEFAAGAGINPEDVMAARRALPGGGIDD